MLVFNLKSDFFIQYLIKKNTKKFPELMFGFINDKIPEGILVEISEGNYEDFSDVIRYTIFEKKFSGSFK